MPLSYTISDGITTAILDTGSDILGYYWLSADMDSTPHQICMNPTARADHLDSAIAMQLEVTEPDSGIVEAHSWFLGV